MRHIATVLDPIRRRAEAAMSEPTFAITDIPAELSAIRQRLERLEAEIHLLASVQRNVLQLLQRIAGKPAPG